MLSFSDRAIRQGSRRGGRGGYLPPLERVLTNDLCDRVIDLVDLVVRHLDELRVLDGEVGEGDRGRITARAEDLLDIGVDTHRGEQRVPGVLGKETDQERIAETAVFGNPLQRAEPS